MKSPHKSPSKDRRQSLDSHLPFLPLASSLIIGSSKYVIPPRPYQTVLAQLGRGDTLSRMAIHSAGSNTPRRHPRRIPTPPLPPTLPQLPQATIVNPLQSMEDIQGFQQRDQRQGFYRRSFVYGSQVILVNRYDNIPVLPFFRGHSIVVKEWVVGWEQPNWVQDGS
jgi:hypothetical protein